MLVAWTRRFAAPAAVAFAATSAACSSSSGESSEPSPTLVTVSPSTFGRSTVCGDFPGAWKSYVATLTDVTDPDKPFVLASSNPVPCQMPVSFAWVVPGHAYVAQIDGYDRDDLTPAGGRSSGSREMRGPDGSEVEARWRSQCGMPAEAESDGGVDADAGETGDQPDLRPTTALLQSNVVMRHCDELEEVSGSGSPTGVTLDLSTVRGDLACGTDPNEIARLHVIPGPDDAACDAVVEFDAEPDRLYHYRVEAFEAGASSARWATNCRVRTQPGVVLPASCDPLSERGALQIDVDELLAGAGHTCAPDDVVSYRAALLGTGLVAAPATCASDAEFHALAPAFYQAVAEAFDAGGNRVFAAFCEGSIEPASTTKMTCQVDSL